MDRDYLYTARFAVDAAFFACDEVLLRCHGVDTVADLEWNGQALGHVENMHRVYEFNVKPLLRPGDNQLTVLLRSPTRFIRQSLAASPVAGSEDAMRGFPNLRKAHCMFGWDWGPRLPDAGIWRDIELVGVTGGRIDSVYVTQAHEPERVTLTLQVDVLPSGSHSKWDYVVTLTDPDGKRAVYPGSPSALTIAHPQLWWPNGLGEQPLYLLQVDLYVDGEKRDSWTRRIGLRTLTMRLQKDSQGESFAHEVNGVTVFAMGADYIPEDNLLPRVTPERTRALLNACKQSHFNAIRVWGGGYYPDDFFYDICDELGLMVWQDFMFACAVYNLTSDFEDNITKEFEDNIKRLRHHASLALWCGNNEMEMFVDQGQWVLSPRQKSDYVKMYEYILPKTLKRLDPQTFYWPASPSSGGAFDAPNDPSRGDVHYWDVWHGDKPFTDYRNYTFRYVSEFGFQSFPTLKTVESFTEPGDRNIFSYIMEKHQRNSAANGKIMNYLYQTFLYPTSFATLLYASQLLQAEAIRYGVEHFRRNRGKCMGAIYWQLNDCWPVASWSSIDYTGRWKALQYAAKRFFAPLLLSCCEEGTLTQNPNVNAEPYEVVKAMRLCVSNETRRDQAVYVTWTLRDAYANVLRKGSEAVSSPALSSVWLERVAFPEAELYGHYVSYALTDAAGQTLSQGSTLFCAPKHFRFVDPRLSLRVEGEEIVVMAKAYARAVEIRNANEDLVLSDNYFDMDAGERRVRILSGQPEGLALRSVYDVR